MQSLHPHHEGSANEKRVIQFIEERLTLLRLPKTTRNFSKAVSMHSFSSIIETSIAGQSEDTVLFIIPLNHPFDAPPAEDGSFGIALGLRLLAEFREQRPALTVKMVFLGGEYEGVAESYPGTTQYLRTFYPAARHMVLYLDLKSFPAACTIQYGGRGVVVPRWLIDHAIDAFRGHEVPFIVPTGRLPVFRTGLATADSPVGEFLAAGYPALLLRTTGAAPADVDAPTAAGRLKAGLAALTDSFPGRLPARWDRHYIFLDVPFFPIMTISETVYLVFILAVMFLLLVVLMFRIAHLKKYAVTLKRNFWNIPFFLAAGFIILLAGGILLDLVLAVRNFPTLWTHIPAVFLIFKVAFFFLAAALLFRFARRFPFSKNGSFYSAAALLFIVVCILIVAWINISFVRYFLWTLGCVVLFALSRSRAVKLVFLCLFPLPLIFVLYDLLSIPELRACDIIIFDKIAGNLLFAVVILPFSLLLIRIRLFLSYQKKSLFASKSFLFLAANLAVVVVTAVIMAAYDPYNKTHPQPVLAEQIIDLDRNTDTLSLSSPAPLGELQIVDKSGVIPVRTNERSYFMPLGGVQDYVSYDSSATRFSNRTNVDLRFKFRGEPFKIRLLITSDADFELYDANFPVERRSGGEYALFIGMNPPPALLVQLTLPADRPYTIELEAYYVNRSSDVDIHGNDILLDHRLTFRRSITLRL